MSRCVVAVMTERDVLALSKSPFVVVAVVTERDVLALSKSPFVVQLFYSLQSKHSIFLVSDIVLTCDWLSIVVESQL